MSCQSSINIKAGKYFHGRIVCLWFSLYPNLVIIFIESSSYLTASFSFFSTFTPPFSSPSLLTFTDVACCLLAS